MIRDAGIADWVVSSPVMNGVLFGPPDPEMEGLAVCAVAVAGGFRGYGKGFSESDALVSAVGESLEQYAASQVRPERIRRAAFHEIEEQAFDPRWLCLYAEDRYRRAGFPYARFDPDRPLSWLRGFWLDTREPVYLPAFAVCLGNRFAEEELCQVTSNGLAAGSTVEDAANRAALELHERDAFLTSWVALKTKTGVEFQNVEPAMEETVERFRARGAELKVYLVENGPPAFVAICVAQGDGSRWPAFTLGLGASPTMEEAVTKAVLEHCQTGPFIARIWRNREIPIPQARTEIHTLQDHALYYCDPAHASEFNLWLHSPIPCANRGFTVQSPRVAIADLTPPDLEESPFRVVRALARGLQPIWYGHGFERTFTPRLQALLNGRAPNLAPPPIC